MSYSIDSSLPLSEPQAAIWFGQAVDPGSAAYNVAAYLDFGRAIEPALFTEALQRLVSEVDVLRLRFSETADGPRQHLDQPHQWSLHFQDLAQTPDPLRASEVLMRADAARPVDLLRQTPFAFALFRIAIDRCRFYYRYHHILADGATVMMLTRRLVHIYAALEAGKDPGATPFGRLQTLLDEERAYINSAQQAADRDYWHARLAGWSERASLASHSGTIASQTISHSLAMRPSVKDGLVAAAALYRGTLAQVLIAAVAVLLHRLTGMSDLVLSIPMSGRFRVTRDVPVTAANVLPLRLALAADKTVGDIVQLVSREVRGMVRHQRYRGERLVQETLGPGVQSFGPTVNVMPFYEDTLFGAPASGNNICIGPVPDLLVSLCPMNDGRGLRLDLEGNEGHYDRHTIEALTLCLVRVLAAIAADPSQRVGTIDLMDAAERRRLLVALNDTAHTPQAMPTLPELFELQAARVPDAPALLCGPHSLSYAALNRRANQLAHHLIALGIGPEDRVALCLPRSLDMVGTLLGILKAGAAYVPLDPDYPEERLRFMLEDAEPKVVVTLRAFAGLPAVSAMRCVLLDDPSQAAALDAAPGDNPVDADRVAPIAPLHPAYVIYTSGSTGIPKGVVISVAGLVNHMLWMLDAYPVDASDRVLSRTSTSFDASGWEIWLPLLSGATLVVAASEVARNVEELLDTIDRTGITVAQFVPSLLAAALSERPDRPPPLRALFSGGETLPSALARRVATAWKIPVVNLYGPTETTIQVTSGTLPDGDGARALVPIGRPIWNTEAYVLDKALCPAPEGMAGELYIAGAGLARGYLNRPDLTAERFLPCPFGPPGARMYRTGDLARWGADGALDFLGRVDQQIKIRGFRIEPGEIESTLIRLPGVAQASVVARQDEAGRTQLVGYVVGRPGDGLDPAALREALASRLPQHMVPAALVPLVRLPLLPNGKLDRRALPAPDFVSAACLRPRTPREEILAGLFADVLGLERVGIDASFFDLGGDSLLATRLISLLRSCLNAELPIRLLFEAPTVAQLAARLNGTEPVRKRVTPRPRPQLLPLSAAQQRLWFLHRLEGPSATYNIPLALRAQGVLDAAALQMALRDVVTRHESLRTIFPDTDDAPCQHVLGVDDERTHLRLDCQDIDDATLPQTLSAAASAAIDINREIPIRAVLFRLAAQSQVLLITLHHIAADGWSLNPLARDLALAYAARRDGNTPVFAPLPVQYADYTLWQRALLGADADADSLIARQGAYWREALAGLPTCIFLPTDRPRPSVSSYRGAHVPIRLTAALHGKLRALARHTGLSLFMVLQAGLAILLGKLGAGEDIAIGSPIAGRTDNGLDDLIGFFVNTLVLRTDLSGNPTVAELLVRVRERSLAAYAHQDLPFERLVEIVNPVRTQNHHPLFQVMLILQNNQAVRLDLPDVAVTELSAETGTAKFDLTFSVAETDDGLSGRLDYATELFDQASAEALVARFGRALEAVAADPSQRIGTIGLLDAAERRQLLAQWNDTTLAVPTSTLPELLERQATHTPDATALVFGAQRLSYAELNDRANRLAHRLRDLGVGPDALVGVCCHRSPELVIALLATLKAGGAYLPLDPAYPRERLAFMLEDAGPAVLLSQAGLLDGVADAAATPTILLDRDEAACADDPADDKRRACEPANRVPAHLTPAHLAYVIYTSGSTGRPKGVGVTQGAVVNFLQAMREAPGITPRDVLLAVTSLSFDIAALELWLPLTSGACVALASRAASADPDQLCALIERHDVSMMQATPSTWRLLLAHRFPMRKLTVLCGGEALSPMLAQQLLAHVPMVWNLYGPTETTIWSSVQRITPEQPRVAIGRPIANTQLHILDQGLNLAPLGVAGELYIAGDGLARCYLRRAGLTAERFLPDPFGAPGARMYRTGDLARRLPDGTVDYLGRIDQQVKIRGFRIELGEIEATIATHPAIAEAAVAAHGDQLIGYVVARAPDAVPDAAMLRQHCQARLPDYMVPSHFVPLDRLPLTANGKLDRKALLPPTPVAAAFGSDAPEGEIEQTLADIWAEVLQRDAIGRHDNFFELGGHSLLAVQVVTKTKRIFGIDLPVGQLFANPSIAALGEWVVQAQLDQLEQLDAAELEQLLAASGQAGAAISLEA
jgi:nonribosomal peptide synthetase DhbF